MKNASTIPLAALQLASLLWFAACGSTRTSVDREDLAVRNAEDSLLIVGDTEAIARILVRNGDPLLVQQLMAPGSRNVLRPDLEDEARPAPPGTTQDHPHQRGVRVAHGDVNGFHLWEGEGSIEVISHELDLPLDGGATVRAGLEWRAPDGHLLCTENRTITIRAFTDRRELDVSIELVATGDTVTFGDEKDGLLGLRLADPFQLSRSGSSLDSEGRRGRELWGKSARWVAYSAPLPDPKGEEEEVTVAFFDHPDNPRYPTRWHARAYGLVAANPFGLSAFDKDDGSRGEMRLTSYGTIEFRYRIVVAKEPMDPAVIEGWCANFTGLPLVEVQPMIELPVEEPLADPEEDSVQDSEEEPIEEPAESGAEPSPAPPTEVAPPAASEDAKGDDLE